MACQMNGGGKEMGKTMFLFWGLKGNFTRCFQSERGIRKVERDAFEHAQFSGLGKENQYTIEKDFNGKAPNGPIPLTSSYDMLQNYLLI